MGCPATGCVGYELTASLDFGSDADGDVDANDHSGAYWNSGKGWSQIGSLFNRYSGGFKGNGHTINNLFINRNHNYRGLFDVTAAASGIETLGVTNANVTGNNWTSILIAANQGTIVACYTTGKAQGSASVAGLAGYSSGAVSTSYSTAYASGTDTVGGLVGQSAAGQ